MEEIFAGVRGQSKLRKQCEHRSLPLGLLHELNGFAGVEGWIRHLCLRDPHRDADETVIIEIEKFGFTVHTALLRISLLAFSIDLFCTIHGIR